MTGDTANQVPDPAVRSRTLERLRSHVSRHARWLRPLILGLAGLAVLAGVIALINELALARVPQNRAALERLIRAHTGLDMRFNELTLRWGWYGPEAVFRGVELGEPGQSAVLLRAPQLVVGFDAWRTIQSGQIAPGRITLVAPEIDLDRGARPPASRARPGRSSGSDRLTLLQRWRGGRLEIEGGTLRLPDPMGSENSLALQLRRATLRRVDDDWSAYALVFLPDRLGRTARITLQWSGDPRELNRAKGSIRFEGIRLVFPGWREFLAPIPQLARMIPVAGAGDVAVTMDFAGGRAGEGSGKIRARNVQFGGLAPADSSGSAPRRRVRFEKLRADWTVSTRHDAWQVRISGLEIGDERARSLPPVQVQIEPGLRRIRGELSRAPLDVLTLVARSLAPRFDFGTTAVTGTAHDIRFDWNSLQDAGRRLYFSARCDDVTVRSEAQGFELKDLAAQARGSESAIAFELESPDAQLILASAPDSPLAHLRITSSLELRATETGWQLAAKRFALEHEGAQLVLDGSVSSGQADVPNLAIHGVLLGAQIETLQQHVADVLARTFGESASRLTEGTIEKAEFDVAGALDPLVETGPVSKGSLQLRQARLGGGDSWPDVEALDADVKWNGTRIQARAGSGRAGPVEIRALEAQWDISGEGSGHLDGELTARFEDALAMLRRYPALREHAPQLRDVVAQGDAEFDFRLSLPSVTETQERGARPALRFTALFNRAQLQVAPELPPVERLRGSLVFDAGKMQRSTLTGSWLGGPVTLRVTQREEEGAPALAIEARGLLDAQQLAALAEVPQVDAVSGQSPWQGELVYRPPVDEAPARVQATVQTSLEGVTSSLPEPFSKPSPRREPLRLELSGTEDAATVRISLSERLRAAFSLHRPGSEWRLEAGALQVGGGQAVLPDAAEFLIAGKLAQLDAGVYLGLLDRLRSQEDAPAVKVDLLAGQMRVAGRAFPEVSLRGAWLQDEESRLEIESDALRGVVSWPAGDAGAPAQVQLARLALPPRTDESADVLPVLARSADVSIDELSWEGRRLGALNAVLRSGDQGIRLGDIRLDGETHAVRGTVRCETELTSCRGEFELESRDAVQTLVDFGFRPELSAASASLTADLQWQPRASSLLESLSGEVHIRLTDGVTRSASQGEGGTYAFPLLTVPAILQAASRVPESTTVVQPGPGQPELQFARLEGDFKLANGRATTSDLHFDGEAEILVRGHANLLAREYDYVAWILRGRERLPEPLRRLGDAPRLAAAWLALREMFGDDTADESRTVIRLQGSWDQPVISLD